MDEKINDEDDEAEIDSDYDDEEEGDFSDSELLGDDGDGDEEIPQANGKKSKRPSNLNEVRNNKKKKANDKKAVLGKKPVRIEYETERNATKKNIKSKLNGKSNKLSF